MKNGFVSKEEQRKEIEKFTLKYKSNGGKIKICRASYRKPGPPPKKPAQIKIVREK